MKSPSLTQLKSQYTKIDIQFLQLFPNGFDDERWLELGKKHKTAPIIERLNTELSHDNFKEMLSNEAFKQICDIALALVKKSSVVSVFEKIALQNFLKKEEIHAVFSFALFELLHNFDAESFEQFVNILETYKREVNPAKWPVVTFFKAFQDLDKYVFVKPTTVKLIAKALAVDIDYHAIPNYKTYQLITTMVETYRKHSQVCQQKNLMLTQAVLFCVTSPKLV